MSRLSKNFSLAEFTKSQTALRLGLDNTPSEELINNAVLLAEKVLQPVRDHFGPTTINSGYRGPELNQAIGGSKTSQHMKCEAADIEVAGVPNYDVAEWIQNNLDFDQLILEFYTPGVPDSGWVHVSYSASNNRKEVMTAARVNGKTVYSLGLQK